MNAPLLLLSRRKYEWAHPKDFSGMIAWFNARDIESAVHDVNNLSSQWSDLSGNGLHAVQATEVNRPTYGTRNGFPCMQFGGSQSFTINSTTAFNALHNGDGCDVFIVANIRGADGAYGLLGNRSAGANRGIALVTAASTRKTQQIVADGLGGNVLNAVSGNNTYVANTRQVWNHWNKNNGSGDDYALLINGVSVSNGAATGAFNAGDASNVMGIGALAVSSARLNGDIHEVIIYGRKFSDDERLALMNGYINRSWAPA
jgi:hypothetical protein